MPHVKRCGRQESEADFGKQRTSLPLLHPGHLSMTCSITLQSPLLLLILSTPRSCILEQERGFTMPMLSGVMEFGNQQTVEMHGHNFHPQQLMSIFNIFKK